MVKGKFVEGRQLRDIPKASVLIPAYNVEKYLERALDSVLNQTYQDFEIILIDDGSTDSTPHICNEYGEKYTFIHVYHQQNVGLSKTRERLIEKATGKYVFWLDSDDCYDPTLLEKAVNVFESDGADVVYWNYINLIPKGDKVVEQRAEEIDPLRWRELNVWGLYPMVWMYASRRKLWEDLEKLPDEVDLTDDVWFTPQIVSQSKKIVALDEILYFYDRTNINSIMNTRNAKNLSRAGLALYLVMKKNLDNGMKYDNLKNIKWMRRLLIDAYCVNCVRSGLSDSEIILIKKALKDLDWLFPQKMMKKFYVLQLCAIYGIDFYCRLYGKSRIRKF